jgi:hypothetical protein
MTNDKIAKVFSILRRKYGAKRQGKPDDPWTAS